jgi:DNA-binding response OmpR family regulator
MPTPELLCGRVLVVEDEADLCDVMAGALSADGHRVLAVREGRAALDALAQGTYDLVLLDIGLGAGATAWRSAAACARPATAPT